jgi:hypothetical protein
MLVGALVLPGSLAGILLAADDLKAGLQSGDEIPGPFQVLNVTGAKDRAGRFTCPVCEHGQGPVVLVFAREIPEAGKPLGALLQKIEEIVESHPDARMGAYGVFLDDAGYREALETKVDESAKTADLALTKAINGKEERESKLKALATEAKLQNVVLTLAATDPAKDFKISKEADVTVLFYNKRKIVGSYAFAKDQLSPEEADKIGKQIEAGLGAGAKKAKKKAKDKVPPPPKPEGTDTTE